MDGGSTHYRAVKCENKKRSDIFTQEKGDASQIK
jgi:hypothetical protein